MTKQPALQLQPRKPHRVDTHRNRTGTPLFHLFDADEKWIAAYTCMTRALVEQDYYETMHNDAYHVQQSALMDAVDGPTYGPTPTSD
jgi:hypothetical protein